MAFHLAAYADTIVGTSTAPLALKPVTDMYLPSTTSGFLMPSAMKILAAYATSGGSTGIARASINAPSLARVAYPYIRPLGRLGDVTDPNVMSLMSHPIMIPSSENVSVVAVGGNTSGATYPVFALLWFCDQFVPEPPGEKFVLRFSSNAPTIANVWSPVGSLVFDQSLPPGAYTVVGFEHSSPSSIAARLVFPGMHLRPGTLSMTSPSIVGAAPVFIPDRRTDRLFYEGGIGVYGTFNSYAPPSLEVLTYLADTATPTHEGYLTVIRTGEAGQHSHLSGPGATHPHGGIRQ